MSDNQSSKPSQAALDLADVPEPWRSIRLGFRAECRTIMHGWIPPQPIPKDLWIKAGERLADIRRAKGLSQQQLADRSGYNVKTISAAEYGRYASQARGGIKAQARRDIAEALGVAVKDIWW